jgi:S1-C subfamily serine protease
MNQRVNDSNSGSKRWALIGVALLLLAIVALAAWWWLQGRAAGSSQRARLVASLERQRSLTAELNLLEASKPADCPPGQHAQPIAQSPQSTVPGKLTQPAEPGKPTVPTDPGKAAQPGASAPPLAAPAPPTTGEAAVLSGAALALRLEQATAIVIVAGPNDLGTGTGFFISPNLLVTNRHVVEESAGKKLFLTSKALGSLRKATVLQVTRSSVPGSPDFALLRMDEGVAPGSLDMALEITKLASVVAAGYPGVVLRGDASFQRLLKGDLSAAPDLNLTQGAVQSLQAGEAGMALIVHTASIAKGNSGGPLVDGCSRVVGVNTFINVDQSQSAKINYAIRSQAMASFLQSAGASVRADPRPCGTKG